MLVEMHIIISRVGSLMPATQVRTNSLVVFVNVELAVVAFMHVCMVRSFVSMDAPRAGHCSADSPHFSFFWKTGVMGDLDAQEQRNTVRIRELAATFRTGAIAQVRVARAGRHQIISVI